MITLNTEEKKLVESILNPILKEERRDFLKIYIHLDGIPPDQQARYLKVAKHLRDKVKTDLKNTNPWA